MVKESFVLVRFIKCCRIQFWGNIFLKSQRANHMIMWKNKLFIETEIIDTSLNLICIQYTQKQKVCQFRNFNNVLYIMLAKYNNIDGTDLFSDIHGHWVACVKRYIYCASNKTKCVMHCPSETKMCLIKNVNYVPIIL